MCWKRVEGFWRAWEGIQMQELRRIVSAPRLLEAISRHHLEPGCVCVNECVWVGGEEMDEVCLLCLWVENYMSDALCWVCDYMCASLCM